MSHLLFDDKFALPQQAIAPISHVNPKQGFGHLIGLSEPMQNVYHLIKRVSPTKASVIITGESGTGKELVAKTIHDFSDRAHQPFIAINCGAITTDLIGSALFGHERGSFTGANQSHQGYFEQASGGTLFLDELPETTPELQIKLLRVLETGTVIPVGGKRQIHVDVRIITATNRDPKHAVKQGVLREDLFYRLNTFPIPLPPLRARGSDISLLANHFLNVFNKESQTNIKISDFALNVLEKYCWPGNVRQLKNCLQRAYIMTDDVIDVEHLSPEYLNSSEFEHCSGQDTIAIPVNTSLVDAEARFIKAVLAHFQNNKDKTAEALGISVKTLQSRLKKDCE